MKKINVKGISEILNKKELKNVMGGSGGNLSKCECLCTPSYSAAGCKTVTNTGC